MGFNLPCDWIVCPMEDVVGTAQYALVDGPFGSAVKKSDYVPNGVPVLRGVNLALGDCRIRLDNLVFISPDLAERHRRAIAKAGDIVFTKKGTLGSVGIIPDRHYTRYFISSNQMKATVDPEVASPFYVYYVFAAEITRNRLIQEASVTGVPKINLRYLRRFGIPLPPLPEQRRIAAVLGALDDKIELNRKMNQTLEAMAQALFKSWFVDFDPVIDKALRVGNPIPDDLADKAERRRAVMAREGDTVPEHVGLFPDGFEDSELGSIPRGWGVKSIEDDFDLTMGLSPPGNTYNEDGVGMPFFQGSRDFGFRFPSLRVYCTDPRRVAFPGDTLISVRAPVGRPNIAHVKCCIGRGVAALRHKGGSRSYTYAVAKHLENQFDAFNAEGTVFGSINKRDFLRLPLVAPSPVVLAGFEVVVGALDDRVRSSSNESRTLATLRDTLLPKLISGEVRTSEVEE